MNYPNSYILIAFFVKTAHILHTSVVRTKEQPIPHPFQSIIYHIIWNCCLCCWWRILTFGGGLYEKQYSNQLLKGSYYTIHLIHWTLFHIHDYHPSNTLQYIDCAEEQYSLYLTIHYAHIMKENNIIFKNPQASCVVSLFKMQICLNDIIIHIHFRMFRHPKCRDCLKWLINSYIVFYIFVMECSLHLLFKWIKNKQIHIIIYKPIHCAFPFTLWMLVTMGSITAHSYHTRFWSVRLQILKRINSPFET